MKVVESREFLPRALQCQMIHAIGDLPASLIIYLRSKKIESDSLRVYLQLYNSKTFFFFISRSRLVFRLHSPFCFSVVDVKSIMDIL
jgi:hypothetical protein